MKSRLPGYIFITGADGVGKSCLSRWLLDVLQKEGLHTKVVWSRFNNFFSKPFLAMTRLTGHNYYRTYGDIRFGYHDFEKLYFFRYIFAVLQSIDVNLSTYRNIIQEKKNVDILICERGPWDTLVDVVADTGLDRLPKSILGKLYTFQLENNSKMLMISRSKNNIINTRPELVHDNKLDNRIKLYHKLAKNNSWSIIDNNGTIEETKKQLLNEINFNSI